MIDMKRCERGHFFDASKFTSCPYCNSVENTASVNLYDSNSAIPPTMPVAGGQAPNAGDFGGIGKTMPLGAGQAAQSPGGGKTMPLGVRQPAPAAENDIKTVAVIRKRVHNDDNVGINPVAGWLVCTQGSDKGRDYRIYAGNNFIGRSDSMDICIHGDDSVSREKHACVSYDDKKNKFYIYQGDSRGLVYVNDETVFVPQLLNPYDVIEIGKTKLLFIPFCGEKFQWE